MVCIEVFLQLILQCWYLAAPASCYSYDLALRNEFLGSSIGFSMTPLFRCVLASLWEGLPVHNAFIFVRDGIHAVADYNSTRVGVVVVVVVVDVVVSLFCNGIT